MTTPKHHYIIVGLSTLVFMTNKWSSDILHFIATQPMTLIVFAHLPIIGFITIILTTMPPLGSIHITTILGPIKQFQFHKPQHQTKSTSNYQKFFLNT